MTTTPQQPQPQWTPPPSNGMAVAGMILGIISAATCWIWCAPWIAISCGIVGIILSVVGMKAAKIKAVGHGQAVTGLVCGIAGTAISFIVLVCVAMFLSAAVTIVDKGGKAFIKDIERAAKQAEEAQKRIQKSQTQPESPE